jgi:hypothetical protein
MFLNKANTDNLNKQYIRVAGHGWITCDSTWIQELESEVYDNQGAGYNNLILLWAYVSSVTSKTEIYSSLPSYNDVCPRKGKELLRLRSSESKPASSPLNRGKRGIMIRGARR